MAAWYSTGAAVCFHDCALSQIGTCPDIALDVARPQNSKQPNQPIQLDCYGRLRFSMVCAAFPLLSVNQKGKIVLFDDTSRTD